jgi:hypothetical protein
LIVEGKKIAYKNVVSKYYQFESSESSKITEDFLDLVAEKNLTPNGPFFYSLMSELGVEPIFAMYSIPVEESQLENINDEDLMFQTYFLVDHMLMTRVLIKDLEEVQELAVSKYAELIEYADKNKMEIIAPFHTILKRADEKLYLEVYLGATRIFHDEGKIKTFFKKMKDKFLKGE